MYKGSIFPSTTQKYMYNYKCRATDLPPFPHLIKFSLLFECIPKEGGRERKKKTQNKLNKQIKATPSITAHFSIIVCWTVYREN